MSSVDAATIVPMRVSQLAPIVCGLPLFDDRRPHGLPWIVCLASPGYPGLCTLYAVCTLCVCGILQRTLDLVVLRSAYMPWAIYLSRYASLVATPVTHLPSPPLPLSPLLPTIITPYPTIPPSFSPSFFIITSYKCPLPRPPTPPPPLLI